MSTIKDSINNLVAEIIVSAVGWLVCMAVLVGAYTVGRWVATHFSWQVSPDIAGLLSALSVLWIYEHRHFDTKLDRIR